MNTSRIALALALAAAALLAGCGRKPPPLPAELKIVKCPTGRAEHAAGSFAKARVTFLCLDKSIADSPHLLRCDLESRPMICEDAGSFLYSRGADGAIYSGLLPGEYQRKPDGEPPRGSRLSVNFRPGPPPNATFEETETNWKFLLADGPSLLPRNFTFVKGVLCDRVASVLSSGICNLEAKSASLYWHIAVQIHAEPGTPIEAGEYREELAFWLGFLDKLVADPAK